MTRIGLTIILSAALVLTGCRNENQTAGDRVDEHTNRTQGEPEAGADTRSGNTGNSSDENRELSFQMEPRSGSNVSGTVNFTEENGEVTMTAQISGLSEGTHAIHLHENADCSADDGSSAGGHWNPTFEDHGQWGDEDGYHRGDIGNFEVDAEGNGSITFSTDQWCIGCDDDTKNIIGKSVIVHDSPDDFTSQPAGNAGTRVGCAEITE